MLPTITAEQEKQAFDAVTSASARINRGEDPSEAVAKEASVRELPAEMARRVAEALNVSRTRSFLQKASGADRLASFSIADPDRVIALMYGPAVPGEKVASATLTLCDVLSALDTSADDFNVKRAGFTAESLAAIAEDPNIIMHRVYAKRADLRRQLADSRVAAAGAYDAAYDALSKAAFYFRKLDARPFAEIERTASGDMGDSVRDLIEVVHGMTKDAGFNFERFSGKADRCVAPDTEPYRLLRAAMEAAATYREKEAQAVAREAELARFEEDVNARETQLVKHSEGIFNALSELPGRILNDTSKEPSPVKPAYEEVVIRAMDKATDPDHEAERAAINAQVNLYKMMHDDPVLSRQDPAAVVTAYNQLAAAYPRVAQDQINLAPYLRRMLEGGNLEPFDLTAASGLETSLKKRDEPPQARTLMADV